jgi:hypothetical protein
MILPPFEAIAKVSRDEKADLAGRKSVVAHGAVV